MRTTGYSIWLVPEGEVYKKLDQLIVKLSRKYKSPYFAPHVTLVGEILLPGGEVVKRTKILAYSLNPFTVYLNKVGHGDFYFRSLFIRAMKTRKIMAAYKTAIKIFAAIKPKPYMPHLSLIYGNYSEETKNEMIKEIGRKFDINFKIDKIYLYKTDGKVGDWRKIAEFVL